MTTKAFCGTCEKITEIENCGPDHQPFYCLECNGSDKIKFFKNTSSKKDTIQLTRYKSVPEKVEYELIRRSEVPCWIFNGEACSKCQWEFDQSIDTNAVVYESTKGIVKLCQVCDRNRVRA